VTASALTKGLYNFDVAQDGTRFLVNVVDESEDARTRPLSIVTNWSTSLTK